LSEILLGIGNERHPLTLQTISYDGEVSIDQASDQNGLVPMQFSFKVAWKSPDLAKVTWVFDESTSDIDVPSEGFGHPALDHMLLARPDFIELLDFDWTITYQGSALWDGEPAWQLLLNPTDFTSMWESFTLIVRKDDYVPLRTVVKFSDDTEAVTDLDWLVIQNVVVPSKFSTTITPAINGFSGFETTFFNHQINPDLTGVNFQRTEGSFTGEIPHDDDYDGPAVFEELFHGFADDIIVAPVHDPDGEYTELKFTFSLFVEDQAIFDELNQNMAEIRGVAISVVSDWDWNSDGALDDVTTKWDIGRSIMNAIDGYLGTDKITDFYFLEWGLE
jgi:hypothetical protein